MVCVPGIAMCSSVRDTGLRTRPKSNSGDNLQPVDTCRTSNALIACRGLIRFLFYLYNGATYEPITSDVCKKRVSQTVADDDVSFTSGPGRAD